MYDKTNIYFKNSSINFVRAIPVKCTLSSCKIVLSVTDVGAHQIVFLNPMLTFISQTTHDFSLSLSL